MAKGGDVAKHAFEAMMSMRKIDVAAIEAVVVGSLVMRILWAFMLLVSVPAMASSLAPKEIVEGFYQAYLDKDHEWGPDSPSALDLILPYATQSLQRAIKKEHACQVREQGVCNIDVDIIINGQDWELSDFALSEPKVGEAKRVVRADFINIETPMQVSYSFIQEQGKWRVDEVEAISLKPDGAVDHRWLLKATLLRE